MSNIYPKLDASLSTELDRYYLSADGRGMKSKRCEKYRAIKALRRLRNFDELACYDRKNRQGTFYR